jgi:hypothetical protein
VIEKSLLNVALGTIHEDESGRLYSSGRLAELKLELYVATADMASPKNLRQLLRSFSLIQQDISNLQTLALRLDWQKGLVASGLLDSIKGSYFAACDIDLFHVQYRALFDHLAVVFGLLSGRPGTLPERFSRLQERAADLNSSGRLDDQLMELILSCGWFSQVRAIRDSIVHRDGQTVVFPDENTILFQVYRSNLPSGGFIADVMFNENIVNFELYAGLLFGYLLAYLEKIADIAVERLKLRHFTGAEQSFHAGPPVIRDWILKAALAPD